VPPLADRIAADLHLNGTGLGLLTTLPVVCMGVFAPVGALASRRFGRERVLAAAVALIAVGTALRAVPAVTVLYVATVLAGTGIAVAGALLPPLVRARFPGRVGPVTGLYTAGLIGGAMLAAALTEPLRTRLPGGWPWALAAWALPAAVALAVWVAVARRPAAATATGDGPTPEDGAPRFTAWRSGTAWLATAYMGGQSLLYYGSLAWLAARYTAIGYSPARAGLLLAVFSATQLVSALGLPVFAHRRAGLVAGVALSLAATTAALVAVAVAPAPAPWAPWLWTTLLGLGMGGQFALALTILATLGRGPAESAAVSGMAFFVGYLLAATGPVAAGALHDLTGGYRVPFLALAAAGVATLAAGVAAAHATHRR
jgi:CP family cyanate transporter-like MFS transporter